MNGEQSPRTRVSRETRLLLLTAFASLIALSLLARLRFPEQPARVNPVPPLLTQLAAPHAFDDLADEIARLEALVLPVVDRVVEARNEAGDDAAAQPDRAVPVIWFRADRGLAITTSSPGRNSSAVAHDPGSGLTIFGRPPSPVGALTEWTGDRLNRARYFAAVFASSSGLSVRPVLVSSLTAYESPAWAAPVWRVAIDAALPRGTPLFTTAGAFAGFVVDEGQGFVLVPWSAALGAADALLARQNAIRGTLGFEVQAIPKAFAAATGARGVIVSWVDPNGPAAKLIAPTDVLEAIDDGPVLTLDSWNVRRARVVAGEPVNLRLRRGDKVERVRVVAAEPSRQGDNGVLGLTLRNRAGVGSEVTAAVQESIGARAGIRPGDVITRIGDLSTPTPARITAAFETLEPNGVLLAAVARGGDHFVTALVKP